MIVSPLAPFCFPVDPVPPRGTRRARIRGTGPEHEKGDDPVGRPLHAFADRGQGAWVQAYPAVKGTVMATASSRSTTRSEFKSEQKS